VLAGRLPGVQLDTMVLGNGDLPDADGRRPAWRGCCRSRANGRARHDGAQRAVPLRYARVARRPRLRLARRDPKVGGVASGSRHPEGHVLFAGRRRAPQRRRRAVARRGRGAATVVSQGCRPIGRPGRITKAERNRLVAVDDTPARAFVEQQLSSLSLANEELTSSTQPAVPRHRLEPVRRGEPPAGDFLIRNILGVDPGNGDLVVADHLRVGRHVQLHLRDASGQRRPAANSCSARESADARPACCSAASGAKAATTPSSPPRRRRAVGGPALQRRDRPARRRHAPARATRPCSPCCGAPRPAATDHEHRPRRWCTPGWCSTSSATRGAAGGASSTLTTTIFAQSFLALVFARCSIRTTPPVPFAAANLCLSTLLVAIGALGDDARPNRRRADEVLVGDGADVAFAARCCSRAAATRRSTCAW
jgi:hypothetical protein